MIKPTDKVYISGPMTAIDNLNRDNFNRVECFIRATYKCDVFNPAKLGAGWTYEQYMRKDIAAVVSADVIVMLISWKSSPGARIEHKVAKVCGLRIIKECSIMEVKNGCSM